MGRGGCLFSPYNNMTVAKYGMLVYFHIKVCLQLQQFNQTILKELLPFLTRNISGVTTHEWIMAISQFAIELGFLRKEEALKISQYL